MRELWQRKQHKDYLFIGLLFVMLFILVLNIFMIITQSGNGYYLNSDTAAQNIYVNEEIREKAFFPKKWRAGNELLVLTPHIFIFLFHILGFSEYSCIICKSILCVVISLTLILLLLSKVIGKKPAVLFAAFFLGGISYDYEFLVFMQSSYCIIFIIMLFCFLCFCFYQNETNTDQEHELMSGERKKHLFSSKSKVLSTAPPLIIAAFVSALCGYRYILWVNMPILISMIIYFIGLGNNPAEIKKKNVIFILIFALATIFGFICNRLLSASQYKASSLVENLVFLSSKEEIQARFTELVNAFVQISGYESGINLLTVRGIFSVIQLVSFVSVAIILPVRLLFSFKRLPDAVKKLFLCSIIAIILTVFILLFTTFAYAEDMRRYIMIPILLFISLGFYSLFDVFKTDKRFVAFCLTIILVITPFAHMYNWNERNKAGYSAKEIYETVSSALEEKDLKFGYSSYWNSHITTVCANSRIEVAPVNIWESGLSPFSVLTPTRYYEDGYANGDVFLLLSNVEDQTFVNRKDLYGEEKEMIRLDDIQMVIYVYDYDTIKCLL